MPEGWQVAGVTARNVPSSAGPNGSEDRGGVVDVGDALFGTDEAGRYLVLDVLALVAATVRRRRATAPATGSLFDCRASMVSSFFRAAPDGVASRLLCSRSEGLPVARWFERVVRLAWDSHDCC